MLSRGVPKRFAFIFQPSSDDLVKIESSQHIVNDELDEKEADVRNEMKSFLKLVF